MSDQYVEKGFLYLLVLSLVLHVVGFTVVYLWPKQQPQFTEPTFIDLQDMPELKAVPRDDQQQARPSDQRRRVARETAPKGDMRITRPVPQRSQTPPPGPPGPPSRSRTPATRPDAPGTSASELLRRKPAQPQTPTATGGGSALPTRLMPSASRMAKLEENYRRRYADEIAEGDTHFLNTNDIQFGSFLRRFETSVYGVWRYPQEAALKGIEGVTPVRITFNRNGEIVNVKLLESSGSKLLDDEVLRTLRLIGPMGSLPRNYPKDEFHLIAFFQYGNARSRLR
ncbi:MAG: energy transducer TonB [Geobacter sp.]